MSSLYSTSEFKEFCPTCRLINQKLAYSFKEFCALHSLSRTALYNLFKNNDGPETMYIGRHRVISVESAKAWREKMTNKSK